MAKKEKIELTPEERQARETRKKEKRKLFGDTFVRACVFFLAVAFVYSVTYVAFGQGTTIYQSVQASGTASGGSAGTSTGGSTSTDTAAPVSNEAEEAAKAINEATAAAAAAGYTWNRTSEFTKDIDVGGSTATNAINTVIQAVDSNANINSVVGGFIGIGTKDATIAKGADAAETIGYHGDSYKLKATSLEAADLQGLTKNGDTYTFTLANADTPKKDGSTALNRLTDDIVTQEEVSAEIQEQVGSNPRHRRSKADSIKAKSWDKPQGDDGTGHHFQKTGQDGKNAEAHALDGETNGIDKCQWEKERGQCNNILAGQRDNAFQLCFRGVHKQHRGLRGK